MERHFVDCPGLTGPRRVHYRRHGRGPALLMIHQSPRSSAEYEPLMQAWGAHFTCIAPDTPGFGQSEPLSGKPDVGSGGPDIGSGEADIGDFADALLATMDALGLARCAAYGFHSGAVILMEALRRAPHRFTATAMGGYAVWTPAEMRLFGTRYLPPLEPQPYGEHLAWLWNRMLEQSWFFPWFAVDDAYRLSVAHDDVAKVHASVMDMLEAGDAYRAGYGAVLRAERAIPERGPPTLITAYDGDPLQAHLGRLGPLPGAWQARPVRTRASHEAASLDWLREAEPVPAPPPADAPDEGFARIDQRLIHWLGAGDRLALHAPGGEARPGHGLAVDLPGHGLSDDHRPDENWSDTVRAIERHFGTHHSEARGSTRAILGAPPVPGAAALVPDLTPTRFGEHLQRAWGAARAMRFFEPWNDVSAATARAFDPAELELRAIARDARAYLRARGGRALATACEQERNF